MSNYELATFYPLLFHGSYLLPSERVTLPFTHGVTTRRILLSTESDNSIIQKKICSKEIEAISSHGASKSSKFQKLSKMKLRRVK